MGKFIPDSRSRSSGHGPSRQNRVEERKGERDRLNELIDSQAAHIGRLENEIQELRANARTSDQIAAQAEEKDARSRDELSAAHAQETLQLKKDFDEEKKKMMTAHANDKKALKLELERAQHLETLEQKQQLSTLKRENRQLAGRNEALETLELSFWVKLRVGSFSGLPSLRFSVSICNCDSLSSLQTLFTKQ